MIKDRSNPGGINAVVHGGWKLIHNGDSAELYHFHDDPDEKTNVVSSKAGVYNELTRILQQYLEAGSKSPFE